MAAADEVSRIAGEAAQLVYDLRTRAKLSQQQLAQRMGTTQSVIARLEGGGRVPSLQTLARVAVATGGRLELTVRGGTTPIPEVREPVDEPPPAPTAAKGGYALARGRRVADGLRRQ